MRYYFLSKNDSTKWTWSLILNKLHEYYNITNTKQIQDFPFGIRYTLTTSNSETIRLELNKYDKDKLTRIIGEDRVKVKGCPKNSFLIDLPDNVNKKLLKEFGCTIIS